MSNASQVHQLIEPATACRKLNHRIETRPKSPGPGVYEYCFVCSLGYQQAMDAMGDEDAADRFVQFLRRDR